MKFSIEELKILERVYIGTLPDDMEELYGEYDQLVEIELDAFIAWIESHMETVKIVLS